MVKASNSDTNIVLGETEVTFDGGGKISLTADSNNRIYGAINSHRLINGIVIEGAGQIGVNAMSLRNNSTISAIHDTETLVLDPGPNGFVNNGIFRATDGGILRLQSGTFDESGGGVMEAVGAGSRVDLSGTTVTDGTLQTSDGGIIRVSAANTLDGGRLKVGGSLDKAIAFSSKRALEV